MFTNEKNLKTVSNYRDSPFPYKPQRFIASICLKEYFLSTEASIQKNLYKLIMNSLSALKGDFLSFDKPVKNASFLKSYGCQVYFSKYHAFFFYFINYFYFVYTRQKLNKWGEGSMYFLKRSVLLFQCPLVHLIPTFLWWVSLMPQWSIIKDGSPSFRALQSGLLLLHKSSTPC